jgi:undecaprenyl-diphosphatase
MDALQAIIIAIVEGLTEYLPVSSTGHMILTAELLHVDSTPFSKAFMINIQFGSILAVVALYYKRFLKSFDFYFKLFVAFLPAAAMGFLLGDLIDSFLEDVTIVAGALLLGGIVLIFIDGYFDRKNPDIKSDEETDVTYKQAFLIGIFQCIAMIPGVSRSAATIIGGMFQGLNRKMAAEFSFFLAVPTMFAASGYKLMKDHEAITSDNIGILLIGNIIAFIVSILAIKVFIGFLTKNGFWAFGYYRIVLGAILLILIAAGVELSIV